MNSFFLIIIIDMLIALTATDLSYRLYLYNDIESKDIPDFQLTKLTLFVSLPIFLVLGNTVFDLYRGIRIFSASEIFFKLIISLSVTFILIILTNYIILYKLPGRKILLTSIIIVFFLSYLFRIVIKSNFNIVTLIICDEIFKKKYINEFDTKNHDFVILPRNYIIKKLEDEYINKYSQIAIDFSELTKEEQIQVRLMNSNNDNKIKTLSEYAEFFKFKIPLEIKNISIEVVKSVQLNILFRILDILYVFLLSLIAIPIILIVYILHKIIEGGEFFYIQDRVGLGGRVFKICKMRTMNNTDDKQSWAKKGDSRVTKFGRFLRKTRIDELPQLYNILIGDMSLVGPRPEQPELYKYIKDHEAMFALRQVVKPGLTGWAQINYKYGANLEDSINKLHYDLYYIKNKSFFLDLEIILRTFIEVSRGSR